jgi:hypothetical protein
MYVFVGLFGLFLQGLFLLDSFLSVIKSHFFLFVIHEKYVLNLLEQSDV